MNTILKAIGNWFEGLYAFGHCGEDVSLYLCSYFYHAGILSVLFVLLALLILLIANKHHWIWKFFSRGLLGFFFVTWVFGFIVYDVGMYTGEPISLLSNAFMAILHAFGMFLLNSDVSEIQEEFHHNTCFMAFFSITHFSASLVSLIFVIKHFGFNVIAGLRMFFAAWISQKKDIAYVFWGMNDGTYHLAESIKKHHCEDKNYRMIIVRTNSEKETLSVKNGMERLFNILALKDKDLYRLTDLECLTTNTFGSLSAPNNKEKIEGLVDILKKELN